MADEPKKGFPFKLKREKIEWDDQPAKPAKKGGPKPATDGKPQYFWTPLLNKRKAKKLNVRESALPKPATTKEEKIKLIVAAVIVILVPAVFIFLTSRNEPKDTKAKKGADAAGGAE